MTRSELIAKLAAKNPALYHRDIERLVGTVLDEIGGALERGDRVELRGFGAFLYATANPELDATRVPEQVYKYLKRECLFLKWAKVCASA